MKCFLNSLFLSIKAFNPLTPYGWVWIDAHEYIDVQPFVRGDKLIEPILCEKCGHYEELWRSV